MLKPFKELYALDISGYIKKKPTFKKENGKTIKLAEKYWLDYLEWGTVLTLLYENGAENVKIEFVANCQGYPAFYNEGKNPFVKINVAIDNNLYTYTYPVINGNISKDIPNQMDIHKAQQRAFVKCVAVNTGLGLKLWQKEESQFTELPEIDDTLPELTPGEPKWVEAVKALKNGYNIAQIRKKYYLTTENEEKLINESIQD